MSFVIDYAWGNPNFAQLRAAGVDGVMRYISHDPGKDLDAVELKQLRAQGIKVGLVFESTAGRALKGRAAGEQDAIFARRRLGQLGIKIPVYFAVDFDATDAQKPIIDEYLDGAVGVLGWGNVGVYGGYYVIDSTVKRRSCKYLWQTYAWSGGRVHPQAHLLQYSNGHRLAGVSCDYNKSLKADWGQHPRPAKPAPSPKPVVPGKPIDKVRGPYIYLRDKDGTQSWEPLTKRGILLRSAQKAAGKYREVRFLER